MEVIDKIFEQLHVGYVVECQQSTKTIEAINHVKLTYKMNGKPHDITKVNFISFYERAVHTNSIDKEWFEKHIKYKPCDFYVIGRILEEFGLVEKVNRRPQYILLSKIPG